MRSPAPLCAPNFFSTSWQNDETPEAMGKYMTDKGMDDVYLIAPDYAAGKDMVNGFKRFFKGKVAARASIPSRARPITRSRSARSGRPIPRRCSSFCLAAWGSSSSSNMRNPVCADKIPLYSAFTVDETTLPAIGDAAAGNYEVSFWSPDLDNPANKKFVAAFAKKYGYVPIYYAAQSFDAINMIDDAVRAVHGDVADKKAMVARMEQAAFPSVRGHFTLQQQPFPDREFLSAADRAGCGGPICRGKSTTTIFTDHKDAYYEECHMKQRLDE